MYSYGHVHVQLWNSPFQIFTAISSSNKNCVLQNPTRAYPVMKFHLRAKLKQWR